MAAISATPSAASISPAATTSGVSVHVPSQALYWAHLVATFGHRLLPGASPLGLAAIIVVAAVVGGRLVRWVLPNMFTWVLVAAGVFVVWSMFRGG